LPFKAIDGLIAGIDRLNTRQVIDFSMGYSPAILTTQHGIFSFHADFRTLFF